ncbi:MAG: hypothetical protein ACOCTI_05445 [Phycisphaeraceae bacterium]
MEQRTGIAAALAIIAAIASYVLTCTGSPGWGLLAAGVSVPLGLLGLVIAASPRVSGGILSLVAIVLGLIGILVSALGLIGVAVLPG